MIFLRPAGLFGKPESGRMIAARPRAIVVVVLVLLRRRARAAVGRVYPVSRSTSSASRSFAVSLDLLFGFVGLLSFGQALFWGGGGLRRRDR